MNKHIFIISMIKSILFLPVFLLFMIFSADIIVANYPLDSYWHILIRFILSFMIPASVSFYLLFYDKFKEHRIINLLIKYLLGITYSLIFMNKIIYELDDDITGIIIYFMPYLIIYLCVCKHFFKKKNGGMDRT